MSYPTQCGRYERNTGILRLRLRMTAHTIAPWREPVVMSGQTADPSTSLRSAQDDTFLREKFNTCINIDTA
jgi:hypothetical protein